MKKKKLYACLTVLFSFGLTGFLVSSPPVYAQDMSVSKELANPACPIQSVSISGNRRISNSELERVIAQSKFVICQPEDIDDLRIRLTQYYINQGYINSGALLLPQTSQEKTQGIQRLRLIEGRISAIQVKGLGDLQASYLQQRLPTIDATLYLPELQSAYQNLLSDPLFSKVQSRVLPGEQIGTAILDLELERARSWGAQITSDNYRSPAIGEVGLGVAIWKRNLSGYGDLLELNATHSSGSDPIAISWTMPVLGYAGNLRLRADRGNTRVVSNSLAALDIRSQSSGWEITYLHKFPLSGEWQHELGLGVAQRENQNSLAGIPFSFSAGEVDGYAQVRRLQLSHDLRWFRSEQAWALHNSILFGSNLHAPSNANLTNNKRRYFIWQGQVQYLWQVRQDAQLSASLQWQWSPDYLLNLERYALGGARTVPGYRENALLGNKGMLLSSRWQQTLVQPEWSGFIGMQTGYIVTEDNTSQRLSSLAVGGKWQRGPWTVEVSVAKGLNSLSTQTEKHALQDKGLHFSLGYQLF